MEQFLSFGESIFRDGLILFAIRAVLIWTVAEFIARMVRRGTLKESEQRGAKTRTPIRFIGNLITTLIRSVAVFLILGDIIPLSGVGRTLLGATSLITIVVGLAAQEAFGNFIAGFFLALYQPVSIGDLIVLSGQGVTGTVEEISLRHTVIKTYDGTRIIIPNAKLSSEIIENRMQDNALISKMITLSVAYDTDIDRVKQLINERIPKLEGFIDPRSGQDRSNGLPPITVVVTDFLESGIEISFRVYSRTNRDSFLFSGAVREEVLKAFRENGIVIPYPTRTLEIRGGADPEEQGRTE